MKKKKQKDKSNYKINLSLLTIIVVILIFVFVPKRTSPDSNYFPENTPTPSPTETVLSEEYTLVVNNQIPSPALLISEASFGKEGYLLIFRNDILIGTGANLEGLQKNLSISLKKEISDGDTLKVVLYDELGNEVKSEEVLITTTSIPQEVVLPKDLDNTSDEIE